MVNIRYDEELFDEPEWFIQARENDRVWYIRQHVWNKKQQVFKTPLAHYWNNGPFTKDEWGLIQGMLNAHTNEHIVVLGEDGHMWSVSPEIFNEEYEVVT